MKNLWEETIKELKDNGKNFDDVVAICGRKFQISKEDFIRHSNTIYDSGYGASEVAEDLLIVGNDFWLERHEYDGSEWWEFKQKPKYKDLPFKQITSLTVRQAHLSGVDCSCGWEKLEDLNPTHNDKYLESEVTE
jgi:hypothetical protein